MIDKAIKKLNISYARYIKNRLSDKHSTSSQTTLAEKHSIKVEFFRKFLFYSILLLIIAIVVWPLVLKNSEGYKLDFEPEEVKAKKEEVADNNVQDIPVMLKPKFFGTDENSQPYNISADSGVSVSSNKIVLTNIEGNLSLKDNSKLAISSKNGDYFIKKKEVRLSGEVSLGIDDDYEFNTNIAYIFFKENMATGVNEVTIKGSLGDIEAHGFTIRNSGEEIFFFGGVELVSNPEKINSND